MSEQVLNIHVEAGITKGDNLRTIFALNSFLFLVSILSKSSVDDASGLPQLKIDPVSKTINDFLRLVGSVP